MVDNITGQGLDVPLLGIREALRSLGELDNVPMFQDKAYEKSLLFQLSTSQVPIGLPESYMGYGAVVPDGYGVSYNLQPGHIIFCVSSFFSEESTSSVRFCEYLTECLEQMRNLLSTTD